MLYSKHDVGPAGISRLVAAPKLVYYIPLSLRDKIRKTRGPSCWFKVASGKTDQGQADHRAHSGLGPISRPRS